MSQSALEVSIYEWRQASENACEQVTIGFGFTDFRHSVEDCSNNWLTYMYQQRTNDLTRFSSFYEGSPVKLRIVSRTSNSITLTWASTNSMATTYTVEMSCCKETNWVDAHCTDNLIGQGCTVSDTTATVIGLKANTKYFFRVYAVYNNWKSAVSLSSRAMETKSGDKSKF